jgi:hypothetical protein
MSALMLGAVATPAAAQGAAPEGWQVTVAPYFMGASMNGTTAVAGREVSVDVAFSDIMKNLEFGVMGFAVARKGQWGVGGDAIWMALGANRSATNFPGVSGSADVNQGAFSFYGLRRLGESADLFFGARVNTLQAALSFTGPLAPVGVDQTKTWVDPIVGLQLRTRGDSRWHAQIYGEIGGFGAGSDLTWQAFPTVGFRVSKAASIDFGYRWMDIDYASGEGAAAFKYDVLTQGPVLGFVFKFN